ncbi:MAG: alpha/beta fold hydrolase, partial [Gammaproteobacteria bacterium]
DTAALAAGLDLLRGTDLRADLPRVTQPVLVMHGTLDTLTPPGAGAWMAEALPQARHVEIARAAHAPHLSHLDAVAAAVGDFARGK